MDVPVLHCAHCGDRLGVYEHIWVLDEDGNVQASSYLNLPEPARHGTSKMRFFHLGCLAPDAPDKS